jgi:hypothetical protein
MNLYITREERDKLKRAFLNMRKQHVISVSEIIKNLGFEPTELDAYSGFLVNEEIKNQIRTVSRAKRAYSIIYSNPDLNEDIIRFIVFYVNENTDISEVIFLTDEGNDEEYYELFSGVAIYPAIKKVHIMECRRLESSLFNWIHNIEA